MHRDLGVLDPGAGLLERVPDRLELVGPGRHLDRIAVARDAPGAGSERAVPERLGTLARRIDLDDALPLEEVGDRVGLTEIAAVLGEDVPEGSTGPVAVVGDAVDQDRPARGA